MNMIKGALTAMVSSLMVAILFAYLFRFPIPMGGMLGPFGDLNPYDWTVLKVIQGVLFGWVFYGILGGFIVVPLFGLVAALITESKCANSKNRNRMVICWSALAGAIPILFISTLDYLVGSW